MLALAVLEVKREDASLLGRTLSIKTRWLSSSVLKTKPKQLGGEVGWSGETWMVLVKVEGKGLVKNSRSEEDDQAVSSSGSKGGRPEVPWQRSS